jgi:uncharacterized protein YbjT (DUF2867 family)
MPGIQRGPTTGGRSIGGGGRTTGSFWIGCSAAGGPVAGWVGCAPSGSVAPDRDRTAIAPAAMGTRSDTADDDNLEIALQVLVAGGHGNVAMRLLRLLAADGHRALGLIRDPDQAEDLEELGAEAVIADLEREDIRATAAGADAVVFAAGAGPGSGPERKRTVDLGGAVKLIDAAQANGVKRYLMVSSMGADNPAAGSEQMGPYLEAKAEADAAVQKSGLDYTIVRPGGLTDEAGTGLIDAAPSLGRRGSIPRDDVAATLLACLGTDATVGQTFELLSGDTPIEEALSSLPR